MLHLLSEGEIEVRYPVVLRLALVTKPLAADQNWLIFLDFDSF